MNRYHRYFILLSVLLAYLLTSPHPSSGSTWAKLYGGPDYDEALAAKQTPDGGCILVGLTRSFDLNNENHVWVLKVNAVGDIVWQKTYRNAEKETFQVKSVDLTSDGGYVLAGQALICYEDSLCQDYGWLMRLGVDGSILWQKGFKDAEGYGAFFSAVQGTEDGGFVVAGGGRSLGTVSPQSRLWVLKVGSEGDLQWQYMFYHDNITDSYANSIQPTKDGGYIVAGTLFSGLTDWSDSYDIWVLKLSDEGQLEWHKMYRGPGGYDIAWSVRQTSEGGYVVGGQTEDLTGYGTDGLVLKLDHEGGIEWQKNYETGQGDNISIINQTSDGGYVIGGLYQGGGVAAGLKQDGTVAWQRNYFGNALFFIQPTDEGLLMASGGSGLRDGITSHDILLLKTEESGLIDNCFFTQEANIEVIDVKEGDVAAFRVESFGVTPDTPEMLVINTLSVPDDTDASPLEVCPYKRLSLTLSTSRVYVLSSPDGLECVEKDCSGLFPGGSEVTLALYAETDASLIGWGRDCSACGPNESCRVIMDDHRNCTAFFTADKGDLDRNGEVNLGDAILALQVMAGMNPSLGIGYDQSGADVDDDNKIGLPEVIHIFKKVSNVKY